MAMSIIRMRVLQSGEKTDRLLERAAERLGKEQLTPKDGAVPIFFTDARAGEAYDMVRKALDESDPDWDELVTIEPRRE
jgi:hypothetical protein